MKILVVGDVYGRVGLDFLAKMLRKLKKQHGADMVIVNGENSGGKGEGKGRQLTHGLPLPSLFFL